MTPDALVPGDVLELIEDRYWRPIGVAATLESVRADGGRIDDPTDHPFLYPDHGVVHVQDIARGVIELGASVDGVLLPARSPARRRFVVSSGVAMTYLHDIGMVDPTREGRRVHPAFAAHTAFSEGFDDVVDRLMSASWPVVDRLREVDRTAPFRVPLPVVLRELLSLCIAHSKSTVPPARLGDPTALRDQVLAVVLTDLAVLRSGGRAEVDPMSRTAAARFYADVVDEPFAWLTSLEPGHVELTDDVIDGVRLLRSADAMRQRGSTLRTSTGYEVFLEAATGEAVYALRRTDDPRLLWVRVNGIRTAGEANLRTAWVTPAGDLRISLHRGAYLSADADRLAADATVTAIDDIVADVLPSFAFARERLGLDRPRRDASTMLVQVERPRDRPEFAVDVVAELRRRRPELASRIAAVVDVESADETERARYHVARIVAAGGDEARQILAAVHRHGLNVDDVDPVAAFEDTRCVTVPAGATLVSAGSPPAFVYIPTGPGLLVQPRGGYAAEAAVEWMPIGATGVVRGAERNSDVVATHAVEVVMVPAELFARDWFKPYDADRLNHLLHDAE